MCGVAGCRHGNDISSRSEALARRKGTERLRESERHWIKPRGPSVRQVTTNASRPSASSVKLPAGDKDLAAGKVRKSAVVIHVQMGEHNTFHVTLANAERAQGSDLCSRSIRKTTSQRT